MNATGPVRLRADMTAPPVQTGAGMGAARIRCWSRPVVPANEVGSPKLVLLDPPVLEPLGAFTMSVLHQGWACIQNDQQLEHQR